MGIDRSPLGIYEFSITNTRNGPALNGFGAKDNKICSSDLVLPDPMQYFIVPRMVTADAGLNLRTGPGTEYDVITLLPYQLMINELVRKDGQEEWIFVSATTGGTEYFGWVNSEHTNYWG